MKKVMIAILALILMLAFSACSADLSDTKLVIEAVSQEKKQEAPQKYRVALVMKTLTNPFFVNMEIGARKAEAEYGIELIVRTGAQETSIEQQIQIVDDLIQQKVEAIVIAPGSSTDLVRVLKKAQDQGIKIVNIDNRLDAAECTKVGLKLVPFISVRNDEGAYLCVKEMLKSVSAPSTAVIIEGISDAENSQQRVLGAKKAFDESSLIRIAASESANWKIDEAYQVAQKLFGQYPDIDLIFCANDMMALGIVQYFKENNLTNVLLGGFDNLEDAQKAIQEKWMVATIDQQADIQGYMGVQAAVKLLRGESVDLETYVPIKVVTNEVLSQQSSIN